jgi:hypothetical protein
MKESSFKQKLILEIEELFPECLILNNDANSLQGIPDLQILNGDKWAMLETKRTTSASRRANQEYYITLFNHMSYASFVYPENKEQVLDELQSALRSTRRTRVSIGK